MHAFICTVKCLDFVRRASQNKIERPCTFYDRETILIKKPLKNQYPQPSSPRALPQSLNHLPLYLRALDVLQHVRKKFSDNPNFRSDSCSSKPTVRRSIHSPRSTCGSHYYRCVNHIEWKTQERDWIGVSFEITTEHDKTAQDHRSPENGLASSRVFKNQTIAGTAYIVNCCFHDLLQFLCFHSLLVSIILIDFLVGAFRRKTQTIVVTSFFKTNELTDYIYIL